MHVPGVARNLISVLKLNDLGIHVTFDKHGCILVRGNLVIARGTRKGTMFRLEATTIVNSTNVNKKSENTCMLWHRRLGHISDTSFKTILNRNLLDSFSYSNESFDFCEHCVFGKKNRRYFPSGSTKSKNKFELIHSNVFGPVDVESIEKYRYFVSFIDDVTRYTWLYFMRHKYEVFTKFKEFKSLDEKKIDYNIKVLRSDNGGKYCSKEFDEFCKHAGIVRQKTTTYTPR